MPRQPITNWSEDELEIFVGKIAQAKIEAHMMEIADAAADRALEKFYSSVGKGVLTRLSIFLGAVATAVYLYLKNKGLL